MSREYYIDENVNSNTYNSATQMNKLYDAAFLQQLTKAKTMSYTSKDLNKLYNKPSDKIPFTDTLKKVGKTDKSVVYFTPQQLYNKDGRYINSPQNEYYNRISNGTESSSKYKYSLTYNSYSKVATNALASDKYLGRLASLGATANGVIDPSKGSPIRLRTPQGFSGYIECLTKNNSIGIVYLASAPQGISDNVSVDTASDNAIGRSQAFTFFSNVGSRQVQFTFDVYADYLPSPFDNVISYCKALKQMNYPTYSANGKVVNSPLVNFVYGGLHIKGIPTITFNFDNTIRKGNIDKATVSVSIIETEDITDGKVIL